MPESENPTKTEESQWVTMGGKKVEIKPGEEGEEHTREALPSLRGEKEKNTKEALSKSYIKRYDLIKSIFNPRDEVVFDEYKKSGLIAGSDGNHLKILNKGEIISVHKNSVFKKSELIGNVHWDTTSDLYRLYVLEKAGLHPSYRSRDWMSIQPNIRKMILKTSSPAGYDSASSGVSNPIYNPVNEDKTVSQRIKEEEESQHENGDTDEKKRDN